MNKVSPLDIRIVVATHPLVSSSETTKKPSSFTDICSVISRGLSSSIHSHPLAARIQSLFLTRPKPALDYPSTPLVQSLYKKGRSYFVSFIEIINAQLDAILNPSYRFDAPPRVLHVPQLPTPPFQTERPARFFWHQDLPLPEDNYSPPCLMAERKEASPILVEENSSICKAAQSLLGGKGILQQAEDGFVYLEISGDFIQALLSLLKEETAERLPKESEPGYPKAHIAVILPKEAKAKEGWGGIKELGLEFPFQVEKCYSLKPALWPEMEKVYFLTIRSESLEKLRERYLLPSKINSHEFLLAFAIVEAEIPRHYEERKVTYRLNVSCYAA